MARWSALAGFAAGLYLHRARTVAAGYLRDDPMAQLSLRSGRHDPYPIYERLRERGPLHRLPNGLWVATGHAACSQLLHDRRLGVQAGDDPQQRSMDLSFLERDPPDHTRLRRLVSPAFSPRRTAGYRPRVEQLTTDLVDAARRRGRFDLITDLAAPLPIAVITDLLGIPDTDLARFSRYGTAVGAAIGGVRSVRQVTDLITAQRELAALFGELFERRRRDPGDDVISMLATADGERLRPGELVSLCTLLLIAGFETTVNLIGNAVLALLDNPEQWQAFRSDPALAGRVVAEALRFDPPAQRTFRVVHQPVQVEGRMLNPGDGVLIMIAAANRDPEVYPDPGRFDLYRSNPAEHLAFSAGIHYCLGAPLARLEGEVVLAAIAERLDLQRAGRVVRRAGETIRGPLRLPVRLRVAGGAPVLHDHV